MKKKIPLFACAAIVAVAIGPWLWGWSSLPDPIASHWNIDGHADGNYVFVPAARRGRVAALMSG